MDLDSPYEKNMEFAFMNLAYFPEHNNSQSHPFPEK
jgi:hypothetical protein